MQAPISYKRIFRKLAGWTEIFLHALQRQQPASGACIFYYHRVADINFIDTEIDDRNVSSKLFETQIAALSKNAEIVSLAELKKHLEAKKSHSSKPLVSLTFDDGYANFKTSVLPILKRYQVPATLSIVTGYVGSKSPAPFDRWSRKNFKKCTPAAWRILDWREIEKCVASGLVTLAAHSHSHRKGNECTAAELTDEVGQSAEILRARFGRQHSRIYAYPFGNSVLGHVSAAYEKAVRDAGFEIGVTTDVGLVYPKTNPLLLPRLEAHNLDSAATLRAKAAGAIAPLYLNEWFHKVYQKKLQRSQKAPELNYQHHI